jgi:hypothetical protein
VPGETTVVGRGVVAVPMDGGQRCLLQAGGMAVMATMAI